MLKQRCLGSKQPRNPGICCSVTNFKRTQKQRCYLEAGSLDQSEVMLKNLPDCFTRARLLYLLCKEGASTQKGMCARQNCHITSSVNGTSEIPYQKGRSFKDGWKMVGGYTLVDNHKCSKRLNLNNFADMSLLTKAPQI